MSSDLDETPYDYVFKLVVIGDSGVGKTNLLKRFVHDSFDFSSKSTIGLDLTIKNMEIQNKRVRAQIWDTAGQERYRSITKRYYRGAVGALIVYDITRRETYQNITRWLHELKINESHPDSIIMLIGNKSDLNDQRETSQDEAKSFAKTNNMMYMETSALDSTNVENAFESLIHNIFIKLSGQLTTMSDKKAQMMKGEAIQLDKVTHNDTNNSAGCAC